jgi:hypothetical protein
MLRSRRYGRLLGTQGSPQPSDARCARLPALSLFLVLALLLGGFCASAAAAEQATNSVTFSCTSVTFSFTGFPSASNNTVTEIVYVDRARIATSTFTFNGPSGSNTIAISVPPGHHSIDGRTRWSINGERGGRDIPARGGVRCPAPPKVTSIEPASGPTAGGTAVTIRGTGFLPGATVTIGSAASEVEVLSESEIKAMTAATSAGADEVIVADTNGTSGAGPSFTYIAPPPPPTVTSIEPASGPTAGGTAVTIKGTNFLPGATVTIGTAASEVKVLSATEITAKTAPGSGAHEVSVTDEGGTSTAGPTFSYTPPPPPHVSSVEPSEGSTAGGTSVTIKGSGFIVPATVTIGSAASEVEVVSENEIKARTGATAAGSDEVVVTDSNGTSTGGPTYTYLTPPSGGSAAAGNVIAGSGVLANVAVALPPPKLAVTGNLAPVSGTVLVQLPGSSIFVALTGLRQVPFGTVVDATPG